MERNVRTELETKTEDLALMYTDYTRAVSGLDTENKIICSRQDQLSDFRV